MASYYNSVNTFESIRSYILKGRSKIERKVANNTIARVEGDKIIIKYHSSDIVELTKDKITLNSCGFKTYTTKERLNWYIPRPYSLYQQNHIWYIWDHQTKTDYIFEEGLEFNLINSNWDINLNTCGNRQDVKRVKSLKYQINKFVNNYIAELINGTLSAPDARDCWYCYLQSNDNLSLGEELNDTNHLESHFEEKYFVPSMLMNAIRFYPMSMFSNSILHDIWFNPTPEHEDFWANEIFERQAKSSLKKFLMRQFQIS